MDLLELVKLCLPKLWLHLEKLLSSTSLPLVLLQNGEEKVKSLSEFFSTYSYAIAHGRNIVNVILVDFRALDTLGEITVVLVAGLAALALIRVRSSSQATPGAKSLVSSKSERDAS